MVRMGGGAGIFRAGGKGEGGETNIWGSDHQYYKVLENQGGPLPSSKGK